MTINVNVHVPTPAEGIIDGVTAVIRDLYEPGEDGYPCQVLRLRFTTKFDESEYGGPATPLAVGDVTFMHAEHLFPILDAAREAYAHRNEPPENGGPTCAFVDDQGWNCCEPPGHAGDHTF